MTKIKSFETKRLIIKPTDKDDANFLLALLNSPKWLEYIGDRKVYNIGDAEKYIDERITPQQIKLGFGNYTIIRKSDHIKVGACGLYDREGLEGIDIGFAFLPEYEGNGYAFEAASRIMEAAKNDFGLRNINAITTKENISSQKLLEKLGLVFIKLMRLPDDETDLIYYECSLENE